MFTTFARRSVALLLVLPLLADASSGENNFVHSFGGLINTTAAACGRGAATPSFLNTVVPGEPPMTFRSPQIMIVVRDGISITANFRAAVRGDVNADSLLNAADEQLVISHLPRARLLTPSEAMRADLAPASAPDGRIDGSDLVALRRIRNAQ